MDMRMVSAKFLEMAKKLWVSPETVSSIEKDLSSKKPTTVVVAKVSKWLAPAEQLKQVSDCCNKTDEEIDNMSEKEAKQCIKDCRDACKTEESDEWECEKEWEDSKETTDASKKEMSMQDIFNKIS